MCGGGGISNNPSWQGFYGLLLSLHEYQEVPQLYQSFQKALNSLNKKFIVANLFHSTCQNIDKGQRLFLHHDKE